MKDHNYAIRRLLQGLSDDNNLNLTESQIVVLAEYIEKLDNNHDLIVEELTSKIWTLENEKDYLEESYDLIEEELTLLKEEYDELKWEMDDLQK